MGNETKTTSVHLTFCPSYTSYYQGSVPLPRPELDPSLLQPLTSQPTLTMTLPAVVAAVVAADHLLDLLEQRLGVVRVRGRVRVRVRARATVTVRVRVRVGDGVRVRGRVGLGV